LGDPLKGNLLLLYKPLHLEAQQVSTRIEVRRHHTPIGLYGDDLFVKKAFNMVLEVIETLKNIRLLFEEINPSKFSEIIDKTHIIFVLIDRIGRRAPHI
jgi:hypothetical protein